ncbi:hypothetical protein [Cellvibrio sp. UBA7661]|uniref:hypothetical protein n=1 Tax=Cellvibrio sp. UBA7661 TaxID=1946311 RepID=UPI002F359292
MRRPILLLIIMAIAFSQSEIMSPSTIKGVAFPLLFVFSLLLLLIWFVRRFSKNRKHDLNTDDGGNAYFPIGKNNDGNSDSSDGSD